MVPPQIVIKYSETDQLAVYEKTYMAPCLVKIQINLPDFLTVLGERANLIPQELRSSINDTMEELRRQAWTCLYLSETIPTEAEVSSLSDLIDTTSGPLLDVGLQLGSDILRFLFPGVQVLTYSIDVVGSCIELKTSSLKDLHEKVITLSETYRKFGFLTLDSNCFLSPLGLGDDVLMSVIFNVEDEERAPCFFLKLIKESKDLENAEKECMKQMPKFRQLRSFKLYAKNQKSQFEFLCNVEAPLKRFESDDISTLGYYSIALLKSEIEDALQKFEIGVQKQYFPLSQPNVSQMMPIVSLVQGQSLFEIILNEDIKTKILQLVHKNDLNAAAYWVCRVWRARFPSLNLNMKIHVTIKKLNVPRRRLYEFIIAYLMSLTAQNDASYVKESVTVLAYYVDRVHPLAFNILIIALSTLSKNGKEYIPMHLRECALNYSLLENFITALEIASKDQIYYDLAGPHILTEWYHLAGIKKSEAPREIN